MPRATPPVINRRHSDSHLALRAMAGWLSRWIAFEKYASFESDDHTVQANGMRAPSLLKVCGTANGLAAGNQSSSLRFPLSSEGDGGWLSRCITSEVRAPSLLKVCGTAN